MTLVSLLGNGAGIKNSYSMKQLLSILFLVFCSTVMAQEISPALMQKAQSGDAQAQYELGKLYDKAKDYVKAVEWFNKAAKKTHTPAMTNLGIYYTLGRGVSKDYNQGVKWFRKAAEKGNSEAQYFLGLCYHNGRGVTQNDYTAIEWFSKAAEQGYAYAQFKLGCCYLERIRYDETKGYYWIKKAADQGLKEAQNKYGIHLFVNKDTLAVEWIRKSAEQGYADSQVRLGDFYHSGWGVCKDDVKALEWYRKAAEQKYEWGEKSVGECYYFGYGVSRDYGEAIEWFIKGSHHVDASMHRLFVPACKLLFSEASANLSANKYSEEYYSQALSNIQNAAKQGHQEAQYVLGWCYDKGYILPQDYGKALEYYRKATSRRFMPEAKHDIPIVLYEIGSQHYLAEQYSQAFSNLKAAAEDTTNPIPQAMTLLAGCYEYGYGTTEDLDKARYWREKAASYSDEDARRALEHLTISFSDNE